MSGDVKTFKFKDEENDKNNKLMSFRKEKYKRKAWKEKYKTIWSKIEDLKNIELNALPVYDRYTKTKIRTSGDKDCTNFRGLNEPEDGLECESFTVISINSLLFYGIKYYLQVYLDICACRIEDWCFDFSKLVL